MPVYSTEQLDNLEQEVVAFLLSQAQRKEVSQREWGRRAFGAEISSTATKVQTILGKSGESRQRKKLVFRDFIRLCQALDLDPSKVLGAVMLDR